MTAPAPMRPLAGMRVLDLSKVIAGPLCTQYLADFGHELLLVHLWSEEDRTPPWQGDLELVDAETGQPLRVAFDDQARVAHDFDEAAEDLEQILEATLDHVGAAVAQARNEAGMNIVR